MRVAATKTSPTRTLGVAILAGLLGGLIAISNTISYAAIIFSGDLEPFLAPGIGIALFGGIMLAAVTALFSSMQGVIAHPKAATAPILMLIAANVAAGASGDLLAPNEIALHVIVAIGVSAIAVGASALLVGLLRLGGWIRYLPYPIFGGFLAGLGWLLIRGGARISAGMPLEWGTLSAWADPQAVLRWAPALIFALTLLLFTRLLKHDTAIPVVFLLGLGAFYLVARLNGFSAAQLSAQGWLLGPFPKGKLWDATLYSHIATIHWGLILRQTPTILALIPTALLSLLLNSTGAELSTQQDADLNQELITAGLGNILAGMGGGLVGYHSASLTTLTHRLGVRSRIPGLITALFFGLTLLYGTSVLALLPKMLIGGLLIYLGLTFLIRWLVDAAARLPLMEYAILLLIFLVMVTIGLLEGVLVGLLATIVLFVLNYSRVNIIRSAHTGTTYRCNVERAPHEVQYLLENGDRLYILKLQGYLFFGTAHGLLEDVRRRLEEQDQQALRYLVMDFRYVNGIDSSAMNSFTRLHHLADLENFSVIYSALPPEVARILKKAGLLLDEERPYFPDLDHAVEWCENQLLANDPITARAIPTLRGMLRNFLPASTDIDKLMDYFEEAIVEENTPLINAGDPPTGLYFIETGQVTVWLSLEDGTRVRLRTMGSGTLVGEIGLYLNIPATASVITDIPCRIYILSRQSLEAMEKDNPALAAAFSRFVIAALSQRLRHANTALKAQLE